MVSEGYGFHAQSHTIVTLRSGSGGQALSSLWWQYNPWPEGSSYWNIVLIRRNLCMPCQSFDLDYVIVVTSQLITYFSKPDGHSQSWSYTSKISSNHQWMQRSLNLIVSLNSHYTYHTNPITTYLLPLGKCYTCTHQIWGCISCKYPRNADTTTSQSLNPGNVIYFQTKLSVKVTGSNL